MVQIFARVEEDEALIPFECVGQLKGILLKWERDIEERKSKALHLLSSFTMMMVAAFGSTVTLGKLVWSVIVKLTINCCSGSSSVSSIMATLKHC